MRSATLAVAGFALAGCAVAEESATAWTLGVDDEVTWETVHVLSATSLDTIPDENGAEEVRPVLSFRCTEGGDGKVVLAIDWRRFVSSFNTEAGFRLDEGDRNWIDMRVDDSNRITTARNDSDASALLDGLQGADDLSVEIVPYSESAVTVGFDAAGFAGSAESLVVACR